jgi:methyl-accepting chemotaxis protein
MNSRLNYLVILTKIKTINDFGVPWDAKKEILDSYTENNNLNLRRISIADSFGHSRTSDGKTLYVGDRDYYKQAMAGKMNISAPILSRVDKRVAMVFAVPIRVGSKINGVLYTAHNINLV